MLFNPDTQLGYSIDLMGLIDYIDKIAPHKLSDKFYAGWIRAFYNVYYWNILTPLDPLAKYFTIEFIDDYKFSFLIYVNVDKLKKFAAYYDVKTLTPEEFKAMNISYPKKYYINLANPVKDFTLLITGCPEGGEIKPTVVSGYEFLETRMWRGERLECVFIPDEQALLCLSQPFEKAWYTFLQENAQYRKLMSDRQRYNFIKKSAFHKFLEGEDKYYCPNIGIKV